MPGDGTVHAWVTLQLVIPDTPSIQFTRVDVRPTGETDWALGRAIVNARGTQQVRIDGLIPGRAYDFRAINISGTNESAEATLLNQLAPGDTTVPSAPTAISVRQSGAKVVEIDLTYTRPADFASVELYRNTTNNSATATKIDTKAGTRFHDENISYGVTYFYWAKVVDRTGNKSAFSPSSGHSITIGRLATGDYTDGSVDSIKRRTVTQVTVNLGEIAAGAEVTFLNAVFHGLGVAPIAICSSVNVGVYAVGVFPDAQYITITGYNRLASPSNFIVTVTYW